MKIKNVGCGFRHPADFCINRPYGSGDFLFLMIKSRATVILNGKEVSVPNNSAVFFKKGSPQIYNAVDCEFVNDWIHFDLDDGEPALFERYGIPFDSIIPLRGATELSRILQNLFSERYSQNLHRESSLKSYFELLLIKLSESLYESDSKRENPHYSLFLEIRNKIRLTPWHSWSINEICKSVSFSRSHVQHTYKQLFGVSITSDIQINRIEHAKRLLSSTDMTVSSISSSCGYENDVHFMRIFKKTVGVTPSKYRQLFSVSQDELKKSRAAQPFNL